MSDRRWVEGSFRRTPRERALGGGYICMESSDGLVEEASKLRNRMCNGPVVADDGLVWRLTVWGGESCGQELREGPSEDGTCKQGLDGSRNLEAGALIEGRASLEPQTGLSLACV